MKAVVTAIRYPGGRPRTPAERLMLRFPRGWRLLTAVALRLVPPASRLRRDFARRQMVSAYAASTRRDFELMLVRYSPDLEVNFDPEFAALGLGGTFRGHEGMLKMIDTFSEAFEQWELVPQLILDLGDHRFLGLGRFHLPGTVSGLEFEPEFAQLMTVDGGQIVAEKEFLSWEKGLQAAGVDPSLIGR